MKRNQFVIGRVSGMPVSDEELLADLRATAAKLGKTTIGQKGYRQNGLYDDTTVCKRFGTWNCALVAAGLTLSNEVDISDERLFENILVLWQHAGRQPRRSELEQQPSTFSKTPYIRRFGSWSGALSAFVKFVNDSDSEAPVIQDSGPLRRKTGRDPSLRLRYHVLDRDRFTCCACGASRTINPGVQLHVDHVIAWSKGGGRYLKTYRRFARYATLASRICRSESRKRNMSTFLQQLLDIALAVLPEVDQHQFAEAPRRGFRLSWKTHDDPHRPSKRVQPIVVELHEDFLGGGIPEHVSPEIAEKFASFIRDKRAQFRPNATASAEQTPTPERWTFPPEGDL